jgi:hypothetical protein
MHVLCEYLCCEYLGMFMCMYLHVYCVSCVYLHVINNIKTTPSIGFISKIDRKN